MIQPSFEMKEDSEHMEEQSPVSINSEDKHSKRVVFTSAENGKELKSESNVQTSVSSLALQSSLETKSTSSLFMSARAKKLLKMKQNAKNKPTGSIPINDSFQPGATPLPTILDQNLSEDGVTTNPIRDIEKSLNQKQSTKVKDPLSAVNKPKKEKNNLVQPKTKKLKKASASNTLNNPFGVTKDQLTPTLKPKTDNSTSSSQLSSNAFLPIQPLPISLAQNIDPSQPTINNFFNSNLGAIFTPEALKSMQDIPDIDSVQTLYEDLELVSSETSLELPNFKAFELNIGKQDRSYLNINEMSDVVYISEFLRAYIHHIIPDWPPILSSRALLTLILHSPLGYFCPFYDFLLSQLVHGLSYLNNGVQGNLISMADSQAAFISELPQKVSSRFSADKELSKHLPVDKLQNLKEVIDCIMRTPKFSKLLENQVTYGTAISQKKKDLVVAIDSLSATIFHLAKQHQMFCERYQNTVLLLPSNPEGSLPHLQVRALERELATIHQNFQNHISHKVSIQEQLKNIENREFSSPESALAHGQFEEALLPSEATALGKDRYGRIYWYWSSIGGLIIESPVNCNYSPQSDKMNWYYINTEEGLNELLSNLNVSGCRESKLFTHLTIAKNAIVTSFKSFDEWYENQLTLEKLSSSPDQMAIYIKVILESYSESFKTYLESKMDVTIIEPNEEEQITLKDRLNGFGMTDFKDLISIKNEGEYQILQATAMKARLLELKLYLYDQSCKLITNVKTLGMSQKINVAIELVTNLRQGIAAAHMIFEEAIPLLEATKSLPSTLNAEDKDAKKWLGVLLTWLKHSAVYKDILIAFTSPKESKFKHMLQFCSWLKVVSSYPKSLFKDEGEPFFSAPLSPKNNGLSRKTPCQAHITPEVTFKHPCHYHYIKLPIKRNLQVMIPPMTFKVVDKLTVNVVECEYESNDESFSEAKDQSEEDYIEAESESNDEEEEVEESFDMMRPQIRATKRRSSRLVSNLPPSSTQSKLGFKLRPTALANRKRLIISDSDSDSKKANPAKILSHNTRSSDKPKVVFNARRSNRSKKDVTYNFNPILSDEFESEYQ